MEQNDGIPVRLVGIRNHYEAGALVFWKMVLANHFNFGPRGSKKLNEKVLYERVFHPALQELYQGTAVNEAHVLLRIFQRIMRMALRRLYFGEGPETGLRAERGSGNKFG